jgi:hypothetical protein
MFKEMLDVRPNTYLSAADAVPPESPSIAINMFLDACGASQHRVALHTGRLTFQQSRDYRNLIRHLDCDRLISQAIRMYQVECEKAPLNWLSVASDDNNLKDAKKALIYGGKNNKPLDTENVFELVWTSVRKDWRYPLLRVVERGWKEDEDEEEEEEEEG